ncbi:MAG TPA: lysylphosphatidylglycerol synthase transmembrane domain-containing protein [Anaerolineales bacterium]|nr:lysylphosphatidylglycerol synthase transmembrane domain-containing protein [Anaerolineales bacterium]
MKDIKRWLPGAVISLGLIAAILYFVDLGEMVDALRSANYVYFGIALVIGFVWMAVRAQVWRTLLRDRASFSDVFWTVGEGYLLNNFLPFRLGEIGRAFLLSRKSKMTFMEILPTIVIERTMDLIYTAIIFISVIPFVVGAEGSGRTAYIMGGIVLAGFVFMFILARNNKWALDIFHKLTARFPRLQQLGGSFLESFFSGLSVLNDGRLFVKFLFWMAVNWAIAIVAYYFIIRAFFPQANVIWAMFGLGMAAFGGAIPSAPGALGTFEAAIVFALTRFVPDESTAFAAALAMRLYNYINSIVIGAIGLSREGQTLSGVYQELMSFRNKQGKADDS